MPPILPDIVYGLIFLVGLGLLVTASIFGSRRQAVPPALIKTAWLFFMFVSLVYTYTLIYNP